MWEVVKTVKGYDITRMVGSRGAYHVSVREGKRVPHIQNHKGSG
jgi:hypothetical protein